MLLDYFLVLYSLMQSFWFWFSVHLCILSCRITSQVTFDPEVIFMKQLLTSGRLQTDRLNMESACQYKFNMLPSC